MVDMQPEYLVLALTGGRGPRHLRHCRGGEDGHFVCDAVLQQGRRTSQQHYALATLYALCALSAGALQGQCSDVF